ncbi:MAG: Trk system potassium transporter TrkA [Synergistaceae bacterium]|nr:Trk system potassium transporter TrkA [Synergistaceae bacterium]
MRIVIVGAGEVGFNVARSLSQDGHDIVLVEENPDRASKAENELDVMVVRGNGARPNVLEKAGIAPGGGVELLIACSSRDEVNILACWIAKKMGVRRVISRAVGLEFTDTDAWSRDLGIDMMVSPERSVAREIENLLETQGAVYSSEFNEKAGIYAFRVEEDSPASEVSLFDLRRKNPELVTIIVYVRRGDNGFIPRAADTLLAGDLCYSFCYLDQIQEIADLYQPHRSQKLRRVMLVGAGKVGFQTAMLLQKHLKGVDVRMIDIDREKCRRVASELTRAMVLWGDGADEELLKNEGIANAGGFVAATDSDEVNLVLAVLAKSLGAKKSIAVIRRKNYMKLSEHIPVDAIVNRNEALSSVLISAVRYPGHASTLALLDQIGAETIQVTIPEDSPAIGVELKDLSLPSGALLGLVMRGKREGSIFIPTGRSSLLAGDKVILFATVEVSSASLMALGVRSD